MDETQARGPMQGVRVLDIGVWVAGPFAASLLADFGAEVIKVEQPGIGDPIRQNGELRGPGAHWCIDGRNKRSMTLNLRSQAGQEILASLVQRSDVLIDNHRPGMLASWGLTEARLDELNPELIVANVSGFGQSGPYSQRAAYDRIAAAMGGLLYLNGFPDRPPVRTGLILTDYISALFNTIGILMALYRRDAQAGGGERIDVAMYECIFRVLENTVTVYDKLGIRRDRIGNVSPGFYPDDMFETADGKWVVLSAVAEHHFSALCALMGKPELAEDPSLADPVARGENIERLQGIIGGWISAQKCDDVIVALESARLPCSEVMSVDRMLTDPHYQARETIIDVDDPLFGTIKQPAVTPRFSNHPGGVHRGAPTLGADTDDILSGLLGMAPEAIAGLRDDGVV